jgi:hypothetical protein
LVTNGQVSSAIWKKHSAMVECALSCEVKWAIRASRVASEIPWSNTVRFLFGEVRRWSVCKTSLNKAWTHQQVWRHMQTNEVKWGRITSYYLCINQMRCKQVDEILNIFNKYNWMHLLLQDCCAFFLIL